MTVHLLTHCRRSGLLYLLIYYLLDNLAQVASISMNNWIIDEMDRWDVVHIVLPVHWRDLQ